MTKYQVMDFSDHEIEYTEFYISCPVCGNQIPGSSNDDQVICSCCKTKLINNHGIAADKGSPDPRDDPKYNNRSHVPECQCNTCIYGADAVFRVEHASEY